MTWDPFAAVRRRPEGDREQRQSISGQADGAAGGRSWPERKTMNERLRDAHDKVRWRRDTEGSG